MTKINDDSKLDELLDFAYGLAEQVRSKSAERSQRSKALVHKTSDCRLHHFNRPLV